MGELRIRYIEQTGERGEEVTADYARPKNPLIILSLFHMHNNVKDDTVLITLSPTDIRLPNVTQMQCA